MEIIFVRHGQSEYNKNNVFTGWHDPGITDVGKEQAVNTAKKIENEQIGVIYSSALKRAIQTSEIMKKIIKTDPRIEIDQNLNERDYGSWSGKNKDQIKNEIGIEKFTEIRRGWNIGPDNGESLEDTSKRVNKFIEQIKSIRKRDNLEKILVVCHGNTIRAATVVLGINDKESIAEYEIKTGNLLRCEIQI